MLGGQRENALLPGRACFGGRAQGEGHQAMNEDQFGSQVQHLVNQAIDVPPAAAERLRAAREQALARQRPEPAPALQWADNVLGALGGWAGVSLRVLLPAALLVGGLLGIYAWQQ